MSKKRKGSAVFMPAVDLSGASGVFPVLVIVVLLVVCGNVLVVMGLMVRSMLVQRRRPVRRPNPAAQWSQDRVAVELEQIERWEQLNW